MCFKSLSLEHKIFDMISLQRVLVVCNRSLQNRHLHIYTRSKIELVGIIYGYILISSVRVVCAIMRCSGRNYFDIQLSRSATFYTTIQHISTLANIQETQSIGLSSYTRNFAFIKINDLNNSSLKSQALICERIHIYIYWMLLGIQVY